MKSIEVYRSISFRFRRGQIIFGTLFVISAASCGLLLNISGSRSWAVAIFLAGTLFGLGWHHVHANDVSAWKVCEDPQVVYWAQPTVQPQLYCRFGILKFEHLTLHLRDGNQVEIVKSTADMHNFLIWLRQQNPSIRIGSYYNTDSTTIEDA